MVESDEGEVFMEKTSEYKYLGFIISEKGDNMKNINAMRKKSIGIIKMIEHKLDSLKLKQYYFEIAMVFFNVILRGSILYASETYYNLTEKQLRIIERIEEGFIRKILKTERGCPISQLYLETGQWPARFQIVKLRMLFLKSILDQDQNSMVYNFFKLQLQHPIKGDWVEPCKKDLEELKIKLKFEDIKMMTKENFLKVIKEKLSENALKYLLNKRGSKGKEIFYKNLEMAEYLMPHNDMINIEEKRKLFSIRNRMIRIGNNFGNVEICEKCKTEENMKHIYDCTYTIKEENKLAFEKIFTGNLNQQIEVFRSFMQQMNRRENRKTNINPRDPYYL